MKLAEIARLCGASQSLLPLLAETEPAGMAIDSRALKAGELFIAIPGERVDGHQYVREVFEKGACAAIVVHHRLSATRQFPVDLGDYFGRLLFVENTAAAMQQLAARVLAQWNRAIVGVTGSAGKTTIKDLTAHVLAASGCVLKSLGNLNTSYGLPLTVGRMITGGAKPDKFDLAVLEMGMSSFGEIARLTDLAPPTVGIVGNVGTAHIEFFGSPARIARAKAELVDGIKSGGTAVLNADDPLVLGMRERRSDIAIIRFGIEQEAEVKARELAVLPGLAGTRFVLTTPQGEAEVELPLLGRHNVYNALAAAAAGCAFGLSTTQIAQQLNAVTPSQMRGEVLRFANGVTVIDDSYNSNPPALLQAVRAQVEAPGFARRLVVAGEMLELGAQAESLHFDCGRAIAELGMEKLFGVRGQAKALIAGAQAAGMKAEDAVFTETPEAAAELLLRDCRDGDLILVKGSRGVRTEKVVQRLKQELPQNDQQS